MLFSKLSEAAGSVERTRQKSTTTQNVNFEMRIDNRPTKEDFVHKQKTKD